KSADQGAAGSRGSRRPWSSSPQQVPGSLRQRGNRTADREYAARLRRSKRLWVTLDSLRNSRGFRTCVAMIAVLIFDIRCRLGSAESARRSGQRVEGMSQSTFRMPRVSHRRQESRAQDGSAIRQTDCLDGWKVFRGKARRSWLYGWRPTALRMHALSQALLRFACHHVASIYLCY